VDTISRRKKNWLGHIMRGEGVLRNIIEGRLEGKRSRGRKRIVMLDEFMKGTTFETLKRRAQERCLEKLDAMDLSVDRILKKNVYYSRSKGQNSTAI